MLNKSFVATIIKEEEKGGWTYVIWPESATFFETRKPVKVKGLIDGHDFQATFLPWGDGTHMLPIKSSTLATINKHGGDQVEISLTEML